MHICSKCGTMFQGKFCPECGEKAPEATNCSTCGAPIDPNATFCPECGAPYQAPSFFSDIKPLDSSSFETFSFDPAPMSGGSDDATHEETSAPAGSAREEGKSQESAELTEEKAIQLNAKVKRWRAHKSVSLFAIFSIFPYTGFFLFPFIGLFATLGSKTADWNPGHLGKERNKVMSYTIFDAIFAVACVVGAIVAAPYIEISPMPPFLKPLLLSAMSIAAVTYAIGAVMGGTAIPLGRQLAMEFYGMPNPVYEVDKPIVTMPDVNKTVVAAMRKGTKTKGKADFVHIGSILVAVVAVVVAVIITLLSVFGNKVTLENAKSISLGSGKYEVRDILGDPYTEPGEEENEYLWCYYDSSYMDIIDDLTDIEKKAEEAFMNEDAEKLEELYKKSEQLESELASLTFAYMEIKFPSQASSGYGVRSVLFDANHHTDSSANTEKVVSDYRFSSTSISTRYDYEHITLTVEYGDGSYWNLYLNAADLFYIDSSDPSDSDLHKVTVTDPFGGKIETSFRISQSFIEDFYKN